MIKIKIDEILEDKERNIAWLSRKTNISYKTLHSLINNKTSSISFDVLEKVCETLECDFNSILEIVKD
ncbi:helix-turn-helix domain-containing protein [Clostridium botulinum]